MKRVLAVLATNSLGLPAAVAVTFLTACASNHPAASAPSHAIACAPISNTEARQAVIGEISAGSAPALECALKSIAVFDGGDLEDLFVAGGQFLEADPGGYCDVMRRAGADAGTVAGMGASLSLAYTDNPVAKRDALLRRQKQIAALAPREGDACLQSVSAAIEVRLQQLQSP